MYLRPLSILISVSIVFFITFVISHSLFIFHHFLSLSLFFSLLHSEYLTLTHSYTLPFSLFTTLFLHPIKHSARSFVLYFIIIVSRVSSHRQLWQISGKKNFPGEQTEKKWAFRCVICSQYKAGRIRLGSLRRIIFQKCICSTRYNSCLKQ